MIQRDKDTISDIVALITISYVFVLFYGIVLP